jgi:two-component system cell cycle response regulator
MSSQAQTDFDDWFFYLRKDFFYYKLIYIKKISLNTKYMGKIMVVEDDPMLIEIYERKLKDAGFDVKVVTTGAAVEEEAATWQPELILLDVVLPDMDGFEVLSVIKKVPEIKDIPVYVFSNLSAREDMERATNLGAAGFLTKSSFTPSQLAEEIKKLMNIISVPGRKTASFPTASQNEGVLADKKEPNGQKVLIIEDEDIFIEIFGEKLKQEGFEVVSAKNGRWGLSEAEKGGFCCVLIDMAMPAMNGLEAIKELRANEKSKDVPIIILSNTALDSEVKEALEIGANEYYIKTQITPGEVADRVRDLIKS